jgi:hypothetical protein
VLSLITNQLELQLEKLRGKGKKGGLTAFLFPPLRLSFASLTLLPPTLSSVLYSLSQKGPPSSSLRILVLVHKRIAAQAQLLLYY